MKIVPILVSLLALLFNSCGIHHFDHNNASANPDSACSIIALKNYQKSLFEFKTFKIEIIDDVDPTWTYLSFAENPMRILAKEGKHELLVRADFNLPETNGACAAMAEITATVEAGRTYQPNGKIIKKQLHVWLEDTQTQEVVSDVAKAIYHRKPTQSYVPIIIPTT